jgi:hypothetical protein
MARPRFELGTPRFSRSRMGRDSGGKMPAIVPFGDAQSALGSAAPQGGSALPSAALRPTRVGAVLASSGGADEPDLKLPVDRRHGQSLAVGDLGSRTVDDARKRPPRQWPCPELSGGALPTCTSTRRARNRRPRSAAIAPPPRRRSSASSSGTRNVGRGAVRSSATSAVKYDVRTRPLPGSPIRVRDLSESGAYTDPVHRKSRTF